MDTKTIIEQSINEMHVYWIEARLRKMEAGDVEYLKHEYSMQGDINRLAYLMWQDYQQKLEIK